ncbi:hypothetical protein [Parafrankia sp. FMc2]|uniref:hypothetical protein n=1 Tax=Parafrankia sp. FMc2 TaxID=3233196 RepID=UPI0034D77A82
MSVIPQGTAPASGDTSESDGSDSTEVWHRVLLALAGVLPDPLLSRVRAWLADGRCAEVARAVAVALVAAGAPIPAELASTVRAGLRAADADLSAMVAMLPRDERGPVPWRFSCTEEQWSCLPLDLTGSDAGPAAGSSDAAAGSSDAAAVAAAEAEPVALGLWRSWRLPMEDGLRPPPRRVYVVTVEPGPGRAAAVAGRVQAALDAAGELDPQVEVCEAGGEPPVYQVLARTFGALLWAREPAGEVFLARALDEVDPAGGPRFDPAGPPVAADIARRAAAYLDAGVPLIRTTARAPDILEPDRGEVVPLTIRTDGRWVWADSISYYLATYGLAADPDLLDHAARGGMPGRLDEVAAHRILAALLGDSLTDTAYPAPALAT